MEGSTAAEMGNHSEVPLRLTKMVRMDQPGTSPILLNARQQTPTHEIYRTATPFLSTTQGAQYPLIKEYSLNGLRVPYIRFKVYSLIREYWTLWVPSPKVAYKPT